MGLMVGLVLFALREVIVQEAQILQPAVQIAKHLFLEVEPASTVFASRDTMEQMEARVRYVLWEVIVQEGL